MNSIVTCVEYSDYFKAVLPANAKHFETVLVVTTLQDVETIKIVQSVENAFLWITDAFYRGGASFRKGLALEEGLRLLKPTGWTVIFDADTLMPDAMDFSQIEPGNLYSPYRRLLADVGLLVDAPRWEKLEEGPEKRTGEFAGYFFLFHAEDPVLKTRPWYPTQWTHAGGSDTEFAEKWPSERRKRLPFEVLHMGPLGQNWCGRHTQMADGKEPEMADQRRRAIQEMRGLRERHGYAKEKLGGELSSNG